MRSRDRRRDGLRPWTAVVFTVLVSLPGATAGAQSGEFQWLPEGDLAGEADPEFQISATLTPTPWIASEASAGIAYFLFETPARIERYDMGGEVWLDPLGLEEAATAFHVDEDGLYVAFGRRVSRFALDGTGETHLTNTNYDVTELETLGSFLYAFDLDWIYGRNKWTGESVESSDPRYTLRGMSAAPGLAKMFGRSTGVSPSDIHHLQFDEDGALVFSTDGPYHGDYPDAEKTWVFPNEALVADNAGIIYRTSNLTYAGSLGGPLDDLAFYGRAAVVLRSGVVVGYSEDFLRIGEYTPATAPSGIFTHGESIFAFGWDGDVPNVEEIPADALALPDPGIPIDPRGLTYTPDELIFDGEDILYLLHANGLSVFRWSLAERDYLETIPLVESPIDMAHSTVNQALYFTHAGTEISTIPLATLEERPLVNSPQTPCGLATAGEYVFVCDPTGAWVSHFTYAGDGTLVDQKEWNYFSDEYVWSEPNRRMYHFRDQTSPNDLIWEEILPQGTLGVDKDSPYHSSAGIQHPIRVAPDGSSVVLGSGRIYDALSLEQTDTLSNDIVDAAWGGGTLFTLRAWGEQTQVQKWSPAYAIEADRELPGTPLGLFTTGDELLVVTLVDGKPELTVLDLALESPGFHIRKTDTLDFVRPGAAVQYRIEVVNFSSERVTGALVEDVMPPELIDVTWACAASPDSSCAGGLGTGDVSDVVDVKAGGMLVYTVWATVAPETPDSVLTNVATVQEPTGAVSRSTDHTTVRPGLIFTDDFESGDLSRWIDHGD